MRKWWLWPTTVGGTCLVVFVWAIAGSFVSGDTAWFGALGLMDPSRPGEIMVARGQWEQTTLAAWWCGLIISVILAVSSTWVFLLYVWHVLFQDEGYRQVLGWWQKHRLALRDESQRIDRFKELRDTAPKGTRIRAALDAWPEGSAGADAEMVIESEAVGARQQLSYLVSVASVLVLIGLVGNFFGLADAVQQLSRLQSPVALTTATDAAATPEPTPETVKKKVVVDGVEIEQTESRLPQPTTAAGPNDQAYARKRAELGSRGLLEKISAGLSVLVCSSVMGILSMSVLMLFATWVRALLHACVVEEIRLVAAEMAPVLQPGENRLLERLDKNLSTLKSIPKAVKGFRSASDQIVEKVEAANQHTATLLSEFTQVLESDREQIRTLSETTVELQKEMKETSKQVGELATASEKVHAAYEASHKEYTVNLERRMQKQHAENTERLDKLIRAARAETRASVEKLSEGLRTIAGEAGKHLQAQLDQVTLASKQMLNQVSDEFVQRVNEAMKAQEATLQRAHDMSKAVQEASKIALEQLRQESQRAAQTFAQSQTALEDVRKKFVETYDHAAGSFELAITEMLKSNERGLAQLHDTYAKGLIDAADSIKALDQHLATAAAHSKDVGRAASDNLEEVRKKFVETYDHAAASFEVAVDTLLRRSDAGAQSLVQAQKAVADELRAGLSNTVKQMQAEMEKIVREHEAQRAAAEQRETRQAAAAQQREARQEAVVSGLEARQEKTLQAFEATMGDLLSKLRTYQDATVQSTQRLQDTVVTQLTDSQKRLIEAFGQKQGEVAEGVERATQSISILVQNFSNTLQQTSGELRGMINLTRDRFDGLETETKKMSYEVRKSRNGGNGTGLMQRVRAWWRR